MSAKKLDGKDLDAILEKLIETVEDSKKEIFRIGEHSRSEIEGIKRELEKIRTDVTVIIETGDQLEVHYRFARIRLAEVSRHFRSYSEDEVRDAYEKAHKLQMDLSFNRQKEQQLRERRDDLERRLNQLKETMERAEGLVSQINVVLNYLTSDLKQVGELIADAHEKQEFGLRIIEAQEEERKRLSREIHDGPAQMLANVMLRSELIERISRERSVDEALQEIRDLRTMVRSALYEVRKIIYDLRPMALDDLGLIPTLKKYLSTVEEYNKITITFTNLGPEKRIPMKMEVALFRLVQEAVQNAVKHAEANEIGVKIEMGKTYVNLIIRDNGRGFDTTEKKDGSFGLIGMRERVELLDGTFAIDSKIGRGTVVSIHVPLT